MLVTIGSVSKLKNGKMENVEIHAVLKNIDKILTVDKGANGEK